MITFWRMYDLMQRPQQANMGREYRLMDREIEAIIAEEAGLGGKKSMAEETIEFVEEDRESDAYTDSDEREEQIELMNDTIDTLVDESQDVSTEGIDNGGWDYN